MFITTLLFISLILTSFLIIALNPLSIGLTILILALSLTIVFGLSLTSWLAFLIFLIYIRGMLVLFSYFVSITPNQTLPSLHSIILTLSSIVPLIVLILSNILRIPIINNNSSINVIYLIYNTTTLTILAIILLVAIVIVVKISIKSKGPLRPFN